MDQRIDMLEREVSEIKIEIAVMRGDYPRREDLRRLEQQVATIDARLTALDLEVRLKKLECDLRELRAVVMSLIDLWRQQSERLAVVETGISQIQATLVTFVTKAELTAELSKLEARMKTWAIASVLTTITAITGIQLAIATLIR